MARTRYGRALVLVALLILVAGSALVLRYVLFSPERVPRDAIVVPHDVATLDAALRQVKSGGTIVLDTGSETVAGPMVIDVAGITIRSLGPAAHIAATGSAPALAVRADDVTLRNLAISAESVGVFISASRCRVLDVNVRGTPVAVRLFGARGSLLDRLDVEGGNVGVELSSSSGNEVRDLSVRDVTDAAIRLIGSWDNTLRRLAIARAPIGIAVEGGSRETLVTACRIDGCSTCAVLVRASNGITLEAATLRNSRVGVALERSTGCEVRACTIDRAAEVGVRLEESVQNRVLDTTIADPGKVGIALSGSANNTLSANEIRGGSDTGILLVASDRSLVERNGIRETPVGLRADGSSSCRILRNTIVAQELGLVLQGGEGHHVLDNRVVGTVLGIAGTSTTGNVFLRNRAECRRGAALALLGGSAQNSVSRNTTSRSDVGILVAASSKSDVLDNSIILNSIGVLLLRAGPELRVEGNHLVRNAVGLRQAASASDLLPEFAALREYLPASSDGTISVPVLANNLFRGSRVLDIQNDAGSTLYAAGNRWGTSEEAGAPDALVSPNVSLKESAWKGTIAIGADGSDLQAIVGHILRAAMAHAGYHTVNLIGIGSSNLVRDAVQAGDADLIYLEAPAGGFPNFGINVTAFLLPARAEWVAVVPQRIADGLVERNLSALSAALAGGGESLLWAIPEECGEAAVAALQSTYGLIQHVRAVVRAKTLGEAESLLTVGAAQFALLPSLEETVTSSGFVRLEDDRHVLPSQDMAAVVHDDLLQAHPDIRNVLARVLSMLTPSALRDLTSQVRLSHRSPESVATEFLMFQGLLSE
ncbi:MAG: right-handed parallel beta-helix repeat-containing protein [Candidatus Bipolaricaulota bacterium]|nr:right-handed parallel beta-helix repeat-containing protein [Candidatus Bipolaricaulota bacterium]